MRRIAALAFAATSTVIAVAVAPAGAAGCGTVTDVGGVLYIDDRGVDTGDVWIYAESNGEAGLQAGATHEVLGYTDEGCPNDGTGASDTLIY